MTIISPTAEAAREGARTSAGQFGAQEHTAPELSLDDYTFPAIKGGLTPDQVGVNVWLSDIDGTTQHWSVAVFAWGEDGTAAPDADKLLAPTFNIPLSDARKAELGSDDYWTTLNAAPVWLRDAVTPSLADDTSLHPDIAGATAAWRKARHERILAEGGFASTYDNEYLIDFEDQFPTNTPLDAAAGLFMMEPFDEENDDADAREKAAAELSRRASAGVGGVLADLRDLRMGDQVSLAHLAEHFSSPHDYTTAFAVVRGADPIGADGNVMVALDDGRYLNLPLGSRVPTVGFIYQDRPYTSEQLVQHLVRTGQLSPAARGMSPAEAVHQHNAANALDESDLDYIHPATPTVKGAFL
jgi:hypothetical protein